MSLSAWIAPRIGTTLRRFGAATRHGAYQLRTSTLWKAGSVRAPTVIMCLGLCLLATMGGCALDEGQRPAVAGVQSMPVAAASPSPPGAGAVAAPESSTSSAPAVTPVAGSRVAAGQAGSAQSRPARGGGLYKVGKPYQIAGRWYVPREEPGYDQIGLASWFGAGFHGRRTANGEIFDMESLTAAHPTLPMPSYVSVTNVANGRTLLVRVNNRGPFAHERIIDLSMRAARELGLEKRGTGEVRVKYIGPAPLDGDDRREREFLAAQPWAQLGHTASAGEPSMAAPVTRVRTAGQALAPSVASLRESERD